MKLRFVFAGLAILIPSLSLAQRERTWIPVDPQAKEGDPILVDIQDSKPTETIIKVTIPGFWVEPNVFDDQTFSSLTFPDPLVGGVGFPRRQGEPGWWDFPLEAKQPLRPPGRFQRAMEIGVRETSIPDELGYKGVRSLQELVDAKVSLEGARPGTARLRGLLAVNSRSRVGEDLIVQIEPSYREFGLPAPILPAGYSGSDQEDRGPFGYPPAPVWDTTFYERGSPQPYVGEEPTLTVLSRGSFFPTAEVSIPISAFVNVRSVLVPQAILITIKHLRGPIEFDCPIPWDHWIFTMPFLNGNALREALTAKGIRIEASRSARYLILTPQGYRATLNDFALWKNSKGLAVDFAYVGSGPGDDVAADRNAIDAYIEAYFRKHYCHGVYVLLVGDVEIIPSGRSTRVVASPDGNNADSDHVYEVLGTDRLPSCYVGRLSVNSKEELQIQLNKILSYERSPVGGSWPRRAVLAANSQNDDGSYGVSASFPSKYAAAVNAIAAYGSYTNPPTFNVLHAGAASAADPRAVNQDVIDAIDNGAGQVLYRGHGGGTSWVSGWDGSDATTGNSFDQTNDVPALKNTAFPIIYSIACQNARIRNSDCIAETWMSLAGAGAVAHFGASVNSYTSENHERAKGIFRAVYQSGFTRLGPALAEAERISLAVTGGGSSWDNNTFCYNLLGCPELTIRTAAVPLNLQIVGTIQFLGLYRALMSVTDQSGAPLAGVLVTLVFNNGDTATSTTGQDGTAEFKIPDPALVDRFTLNYGGVVKEVESNYVPEWVWMPLEKDYPEGTPVTVEVCQCNKDETQLEVRVPGFWKRTITYDGELYTQIRFPDPVLFGEGFPRLEALDAASTRIGLRGLLDAEGLLADRAPFLKKDDRNWFDFPDDQNGEKFMPNKYMEAMRIGVRPAAFPEGAVGQRPTTAKEMLALGIDPAGARPGIPHLRGLISAALGSRLGENFKVEHLRNKKMRFALTHPLAPAGFQGSDQGENEGYPSPELVDRDFYQNNRVAYEGAEPALGRVQRIGGAFGGCQLSLPLCDVVDPSELNVSCLMSCRVVHRNALARNYDSLPWDQWIAKPPFVNGASLRERLTLAEVPILTIRTARYLIVTPREFEDELAAFADWKRQKGLQVRFVFVGNDPADDVAPDRDEIDEYLENYYHQNFFHGVYVLLVGDVDRIPGGRSNKVIAAPDYSNADSDQVYEVIGNDDFASLYVGRLSIDNAADLTVQLDKILAYEQSPAVGLWPTRVTLAANSQNDNDNYGVDPTHPSKYAAAVNAIANYTNYTSPPTFTVRHAGAANNNVTRAVNADVIADIEGGRGQVLYRGHGSSSAWVSGWDGSSNLGTSFGSTQISSLDNNTIFPIVYSIACQNNRINQNDCAGENWMSRVGGGAVAYWSASVNSYTSENHERAKGIFRAIYESGVTRLGPALAEAEIISSNTYGNDQYWRSNTFCYILLGDPEMTIRRNRVFPTYVLNTTLQGTLGEVQVSVRDEFQNPLRGQRVNLILTDGSVVNGLTNPDGDIMIPVDPTRVARYVVLDDNGGGLVEEDSGTASGTVIALDNSTIPEGNPPGYRVGILRTVVDGVVTSATYSLVAGAGADHNALFRIVSGRLEVLTSTDAETLAAYSVRVRATFGGGQAEEVLIITVVDDRTEDADGDSLTELDEETLYGTDDTNPDTDGDGLGDEVEVGLAALGFNPAVDDTGLIATLEGSTGFFTKQSIVDANVGNLFVEKQPDGQFLLHFQLQELDEVTKTWMDLGPPADWLYNGGEDRHFFRIEIEE